MLSPNDLPHVTCICPTYNRPTTEHQWLIEEAIECFLRQDYAGTKEMLILNDTPGQTLVCDRPGVRIINLPARCSSLGEKYNLLCSMARGSLILPWEDDDLSLPWRIRVSVDYLTAMQQFHNEEASYFNPGAYFALLYKDGQPHTVETRVPNGIGHNCSIFTRLVWQIQPYPLVSGPQDAMMDAALKKRNPDIRYEAVPQTDWFYIYRWGVQPNHLSAFTQTDAYYAQVGRLPVIGGTFHLNPHWRRDYLQTINDALGFDVHPQMA